LLLRVALLPALEGARPSGTLEWVSAAVPAVTRAATRAVQRRRPRIAAGSALTAAGSLARLRAASAEPLR
jgi:hypothetical protein